jgi:LacI family transcriptional regulator
LTPVSSVRYNGRLMERSKGDERVAEDGARPAAMKAARLGRDPTIFDVAALAGVSKSTVSNVVRGSAGVAETTQARVERAIEILRYRPNALARQFVQQRTSILGVLVGDLDNPFYAEMAKRVEHYAFDAGYTAMFCNIEGDDDFAASRVDALLEQRVAGVVFLAFFGRSPGLEATLHANVPVAFVGLREDWGDSVAANDSAGARLATEHLLEAGHRRISYLTTHHVEARASRARLSGYRSAMRASGAQALPPLNWEPGSHDAIVKGRRVALVDQLAGPNGTTAVFCSNDLGAIALLDFADHHGLRVAEDLSIVGFDNVALSGLARISLTTIGQPFDAIAQRGIEMLRARLDGSMTGVPRHELMTPALVVRHSTGPPRARG